MKKKTMAVLLMAVSLALAGCRASHPKEARPAYKEAFQEMCRELDRRYESKIKVLNLEMSEEEYQAKKAEVHKRISDVSSEGELYCLLQEFAAGFQDIHTTVKADCQEAPEEFYFLPYSFVACGGAFYMNRCPVEEADYLGWKLTGINEYTIQEVLEKMSGFVSKENEYSLDINMETALSSADVLKYLGIIENERKEVLLTLENPETQEEGTQMCKCVNYGQKEDIESRSLSRKEAPETAPAGTYRSFALENKAYFIQINQHAEDEKYSVNQFQEQIIMDLEKYKPEKLILDLRYNSG